MRDTTPGEEDNVQSTIHEVGLSTKPTRAFSIHMFVVLSEQYCSLQVKEAREKICNFDGQDAESHLSKSDVNRKIIDDSPTKPVDESSGTAGEAPRKLRLRTARDDALPSNHIGKSMPSKTMPKGHGLSPTFVVSVGIPLAVTLFVAFSGIWMTFRP